MFFARNALATLLISIVAAAAWLGLPTSVTRFVDGVPPSLVSTAALAWADMHCGARLQLKASAPRLMKDDLLRLSGGFDEQRARNGLDAACESAIAAAAGAAETAAADTGPARAPGSDAIALSR